MKKNIGEYFKELKDILGEVVATDADGKVYQLEEAVDKAVSIIAEKAIAGGQLLFIGNGASASIASHMATDFWKNGGIKAHAFNDSSLLTCISNDFGYKFVFEKPVEMFAEANDILIGISSSGQSENILRGVSAAKKKNIGVLTFSGFKDNNPLRSMGDINFYVPSMQYGLVEIIHTSICHCLVDMVIRGKEEV